MRDVERLLYDMARWMQQAERVVEHPAAIEFMDAEMQVEHEGWLAEGRRLREQADRAVGFPRGVR